MDYRTGTIEPSFWPSEIYSPRYIFLPQTSENQETSIGGDSNLTDNLEIRQNEKVAKLFIELKEIWHAQLFQQEMTTLPLIKPIKDITLLSPLQAENISVFAKQVVDKFKEIDPTTNPKKIEMAIITHKPKCLKECIKDYESQISSKKRKVCQEKVLPNSDFWKFFYNESIDTDKKFKISAKELIKQLWKKKSTEMAKNISEIGNKIFEDYKKMFSIKLKSLINKISEMDEIWLKANVKNYIHFKESFNLLEEIWNNKQLEAIEKNKQAEKDLIIFTSEEKLTEPFLYTQALDIESFAKVVFDDFKLIEPKATYKKTVAAIKKYKPENLKKYIKNYPPKKLSRKQIIATKDTKKQEQVPQNIAQVDNQVTVATKCSLNFLLN